MSKIHMGSDATLIAVASIPPRIWEQDKATWKAWYLSLKAKAATKQTYKRIIAEFYWEVEKPISQITEQDILDYFADWHTHVAASTINARARIMRAYWTFAKQQAEVVR